MVEKWRSEHKNFHAKAKQRQTRNNKDHLYDEAHNLYEDEHEISEVLVSYFEGVFGSNAQIDTQPVIDEVSTKIMHDMAAMLESRTLVRRFT